MYVSVVIIHIEPNQNDVLNRRLIYGIDGMLHATLNLDHYYLSILYSDLISVIKRDQEVKYRKTR